jgi:hypothetical protein
MEKVVPRHQLDCQVVLPWMKKLLAAFVAAAALALAPAADAATYNAPDSIPHACGQDATVAIENWLATVPNNNIARFKRNGCYRVEGTIDLVGRLLVLDGNGSTFRSLNPMQSWPPDGAPPNWQSPDSHRVMFSIRQTFWTALQNMTIRSAYDQVAGHPQHSPYVQWAHGVEILGAGGFLTNVHIRNVGGDCVYFGLNNTARGVGNVDGGSCTTTGRNGVSVVAGNNIGVTMPVDDIGYIGYDVEPDVGGNNGADNVVFQDTTIGQNDLLAFAVLGNAPIEDVTFRNITVNSSQGLEVRVTAEAPFAGFRPQRVTIDRITSTAAPTSRPPAMYLTDVDGLTVTNNTVATSGGTMAQVRNSRGVTVHEGPVPSEP